MHNQLTMIKEENQQLQYELKLKEAELANALRQVENLKKDNQRLSTERDEAYTVLIEAGFGAANI